MDHAFGKQFVAARLSELGFLPPDPRGASDEQLRTAVMAYQGWHGLEVDGWVGPFTGRHLELSRFCGCPDVMGVSLDEALARWPQQKVTWQVRRGTFPGFTPAQTADLVRRACAAWTALIGLDLAQQQDGPANVVIDFGPIDGPGKVLAQSELPVNVRPTDTLQQLYDSGEAWVDSANPRPNEIDALAVLIHEWGHALGLSHIPGNTGDIMNAIYNPAVRAPQAGDRREILRRYPARQRPPATPPDLPPAVPPAAKVFTIRFPRPVTEIQVSGVAA